MNPFEQQQQIANYIQPQLNDYFMHWNGELGKLRESYQQVSLSQQQIQELNRVIDPIYKEMKELKDLVYKMCKDFQERIGPINNVLCQQLQATHHQGKPSQSYIEPTVHSTKQDHSKKSNPVINIAVFRLPSSIGPCETFEYDLAQYLEEMVTKSDNKYIKSLLYQINYTPKFKVCSVKGIDDILRDNYHMVLVLCYTATVRVEAETVVPFRDELLKMFNGPVSCVVLRFGENSSTALVSLNSSPDNEEIASKSIFYNGEGIIHNEANYKTLYDYLKILFKK